MTKINFDINTFHLEIINWQQTHGRNNLPWQASFDPYSVWVSEIMLQQTQVKTVIEYYKKFVLNFPDLISLANANEDEVMNHWAGLGYYARARNLHKAAKIIAFELNCKFPDSFEDIIRLPGIGKSTAHAILSICYGQATPILDGNVKRIFSRLFAIDKPTSSKEIENEMWRISEKLMPKTNTQRYTQGLMDLGSGICTRTKPNCNLCPIQKYCIAFEQNNVDQFPIPKAKKTKPLKYTTFYVYKHEEKLLLIKNIAKGIWGGLYSFPEKLLTTLKSEPIFEKQQKHVFTHFSLIYDVELIHIEQPENLNAGENSKWIPINELFNHPFPTPIKKIISAFLNKTP